MAEAPHLRLKFTLEKTASQSMARAGRFRLRGKEVLTPTFMPVGTHGSVRHVQHSGLQELGVQVILGNTYHLMQRPGCDVFDRVGGLHKFMNWDGLILTDSGGFQIFSLPKNRKMTEEGAEFRSYYGGDIVFLSPETSLKAQASINSDIMMVLDECVPSTVDRSEATRAMELTHRWALRSLKARPFESTQALFGIVQGAVYEPLRKQSAEFLRDQPFDGVAIGGLAVGEGRGERERITEFTTPYLPQDKPRYLMGVGTPIDLLEAVHRGVDMFDCILPSALGEQGTAFTWQGKIKLRRRCYQLDQDALSNECPCFACKNYSRAYLAHLVRAGEALGKQLLATHNMAFYTQLMQRMREAILQDRFLSFYNEWKEILDSDDDKHPITLPKKGKSRNPFRKLGNYQIHQNKAGFWTVMQESSGEIIHSVNDPLSESCELYVGQSGLKEILQRRLEDSDTASPGSLVVWDVGLGAGFNAMAAMKCAMDLGPEKLARPLQLVSFENDLDALRLALSSPGQFPHLWHQAPKRLLESFAWTDESRKIQWKLFHGDFLEKLVEADAPDLIYFDPFSSKTDRDCWTLETFQKLKSLAVRKPHALFTYSASTAVRATLLAAGYCVGEGSGSGPKASTTVAWTPGYRLKKYQALPNTWLNRWERSHAKWPLQPEQTVIDESLLRASIKESIEQGTLTANKFE